MFKYTVKFMREPSQPYTVITPSTPLAELELFLQDKLFALGESGRVMIRVNALVEKHACPYGSDGLGEEVRACCGNETRS